MIISIIGGNETCIRWGKALSEKGLSSYKI